MKTQHWIDANEHHVPFALAGVAGHEPTLDVARIAAIAAIEARLASS